MLTDLFWRDGVQYNINNRGDYQEAVNRAFKDFSSRTLDKIVDNAKVDEIKRKEAQQYIVDRFYAYFNEENVVDFETWHNETCEEFLKRYNEAIKDNYKAVRYGKAQKIVNMMFKYLYCYSNAEHYEEKFQNCHLTLDSYTLEWFQDKVVKKLNETRKKGKDYIKKMEGTWSNLEKGDKECIWSYLWIQNEIKKYLNTCPHDNQDNPFKAEFSIWDDYRNMRLEKEFTKIFSSYVRKIKEDDNTINDEQILDKLKLLIANVVVD